MAPEQIRQRLEDSGLRCTSQRYSVMSFLMAHHEHPTAAEIFEACNRVDPRLSRASTYNNLRDLVEAGLVRQVAAEGRAARYDAKNEQHHHFICDRCGSVEDIPYYSFEQPTPKSLGNRVIRDTELIVRGLCPQCAPRKRSATSAKKSRTIN